MLKLFKERSPTCLSCKKYDSCNVICKVNDCFELDYDYALTPEVIEIFKKHNCTLPIFLSAFLNKED